MTGNQRKRLIEALKAERIRLNRMTDQASDSGNRLSSPELLHQSGIVGSLINDLDQQSESEHEGKDKTKRQKENGENNENNI